MNPNPIPDYTKDKIRQQANNRCGYCLSLQKYVLGLLEIEHIILNPVICVARFYLATTQKYLYKLKLA
jgi:hypothetical protein